MGKTAIIGTTSWGTTLGIVLARKGMVVSLWARTNEEAEALSQARENAVRLPSIPFPQGLEVTASLSEALRGAEMTILAVPSHSLRENLRLVRKHLRPSSLLLSAVKGLEKETAKRMSQVIKEELDTSFHHNICVLSGPNLSREIAQGLPATTVIAAEDSVVARRAQDLVMTPNFRVYTNTDVIGVEFGGALKNIIAIGAGIGHGWGYGDNAKAAFLTRGLAEITRLGVAAGAKALTFLGLSGLGDLVTTCSSPLSRNNQVGQKLAKGRTLTEILASLKNVAEGIATTAAARNLSHKLGVEMPITDQTYRVLYEGADPRQAAIELMGREPKDEFHGIH